MAGEEGAGAGAGAKARLRELDELDGAGVVVVDVFEEPPRLLWTQVHLQHLDQRAKLQRACGAGWGGLFKEAVVCWGQHRALCAAY